MNLIVSGIFIHLILMGAIFDTYFTSPLIKGMKSYKNEKNPPAKRLVLVIADGLRAESLYGTNYSGIPSMKNIAPHLSSKITSLNSSWGISHTRVPTESRPGHVALTAGIYEDPSAIAKGWKENPVEFDSVFNKSYITWAWGSPDIVPLFAKSENVRGFSYSPEEEDFSGKVSTSLLDTWVFDQVEMFFSNQEDSEQINLMRSDKVIFFLHLLGLDTAGHTHKPYSKEHIENIKVVDQGIRRIEEIVNAFYKDNDTIYIFTADHGMTDWGSHGAGTPAETETPFIAWGAGILPCEDPIEIRQADICPLISTLIGTPIPVNSIGVLPVEVLNMSEEYIAHAIFTNAKQIFAQYDEKRQRTENNSLRIFYKPYPELSKQQFKNVISTIEYSLKDGDYIYVIRSCQSLIQASLRGLDYYQNYYQRLLLSCSVLTYIGWISLLLIYLTEPIKEPRMFITNAVVSGQFNKYIKQAEYFVILHLVFFLLILVSWFILHIQSLPLMYYVYCTVPLYIWWSILEKTDEWIPRIRNVFSSVKKIFETVGACLFYIFGIESLVLCFFYRETLSITLIILSLWPYSFSRVKLVLKLAWTATCITLAVFPFMPVVGSSFNLYLIVITAVSWILTNFGSLFLPFCILNPGCNYYIDKKQIYLTTIQSLLLAFAVYNLYAVDISFRNKNGLAWHNQWASWMLSGVSIFVTFLGSDFVLGRLFNIVMALLIPFILLSVSYEPLFLLVLFVNLMVWLAIELQEYSPMYRNLALIPFNSKLQRRNLSIRRTKIYSEDFRRGFFIVLYVVLAFFGMGNIASINSFDPMWVRNFLTVFSPFTMTTLILFKIIIPYLVVSCIFRAITVCLQAPVKKLFFIVLIFCDMMGLHFLFLVKNYGSWLEIGSSISHYVIVQVMVLFLLLLYSISKSLTDYNLLGYRKIIPIYPYKVHRR